MKKTKVIKSCEIVINLNRWACSKCRHIRENEPYVWRTFHTTKCFLGQDFICWRCCRDAESTLLILHRWPLAFERFNLADGYILDWAPGVKALIGEPDETKTKT